MKKRERARAGTEPAAAAPSQPDWPGVSRPDHSRSAGSKNRLRDELQGYVRTDTVDWGWEEGERKERNKRKRQPGRTGAGQRRERQMN